MTAEERAFITQLLDRMNSTYSLFRVELWTYRAGAVTGVLLLVIASAWTLFRDTHDLKTIGPLLVSNGLFAVTGDRSVKLLREQLDTIRQVIDRVLTPGVTP